MSTLIRAVVTALLYFVAARASVLLHDVAELGAVFWPGAGITVTALLVSPRRTWPAILVAVGATELGNDLSLGFGLAPSLWWAVANMIEPAAVAWLAQRWGADRFDRVRSVAWFVVATLVGTGLGGSIGAIGTTANVSALPYAVTLGQWVAGDGLGILTVVPLGLVLFARIPATRLRSIEAFLVFAAVLAATVLVFGLGHERQVLLGDYLVLIPLVWAAVRLRVAGAAVALFVLAQTANTVHAFGLGPFAQAGNPEFTAAAQLQLFLGTVGVTALMLGARTVESAGFRSIADARDQLLASVSHELRAPLTPIVGFSEMLLGRHADIDPRIRQAAEVIHRNGLHLTALVENLLRASRTRLGQIPVAPAPVEVAHFVETLLLGRAEEAIEADVDPEAVAWIDPIHLTQILTNLLDNALRHGKPPVRLRVARDASEVEIRVTDQGDGVPEWFAGDLFEEFAQAATADERSSAGLGLGLPIARSLARANGGELSYQPVAVGACFVLRLPAPPFGHGVVDVGP